MYRVPEGFPACLKRALLSWTVVRHVGKLYAERVHLPAQFFNFIPGNVPDRNLFAMIPGVRQRISQRDVVLIRRDIQRNEVSVPALPPVIIDQALLMSMEAYFRKAPRMREYP